MGRTAIDRGAAPARHGQLFILALTGAVLLFSPGAARGDTFGSIEAISTGDGLPRTGAIAVLPDRNDMEYLHDPLYRAVRETVAAALRERGMRVSETGPLTLRIRIHRPLFARDGRSDDPAQSPADVEPEPSRAPDVVDQVEIPLQLSKQDVEASLSLALLLSDAAGKPLWSANASASGRVAERESVVRRLSAAAVSDMGTSVRRNFLLDCDRAADGASNLCLD